MAEVWKKVVEKKTRPWGRGIECLLECGHTEVREVPPRLGKMLICRECSTPPRELPQALAEPLDFTVVPRPKAAGAEPTIHQRLDTELRRLGFGGMVASTPVGMMIIPGPPYLSGFKVVDPKRAWNSLSALEFEPTIEELGRICAGDSECEAVL